MRTYEPLFAGDAIEVQTWTCEGVGFRHSRCFCVLRDGSIVAEANSVWALINLKDNTLVKIEDMPYRIEPDSATVLLDLPPRLKLPKLTEMEQVGERRIVYSDIDYNGHMNNTRYPDMLCDFVPDMLENRMAGIVISYRHEAAFDHTLRVFRTKTGGGYLFRLVDEDERVCTEAFVRICSASS